MRESLGVKPEGGMKVNVGVIRMVQHRPDWISLKVLSTSAFAETRKMVNYT